MEIGALGIESFDHMAAMYDVLELSTAVKPWLLAHLMKERGAERLLYLDPDIRLYDPLDEVDALLKDHSLVVTPHLSEPMPRDGGKPSERDILESGSYNLGFLGIADRPESHRLLDWWSERLATDCIVEPSQALFVDQRWMDLAPGLVERFHVLRDPGYNVAYWNLAGRKVRRVRRRLRGERAARCASFTSRALTPRVPDRLSKHQDRIKLGAEPVLRELCDGYREELAGERLPRGHGMALLVGRAAGRRAARQAAASHLPRRRACRRDHRSALHGRGRARAARVGERAGGGGRARPGPRATSWPSMPTART